MPSANSSWCIPSVRSINGSTATDFCGSGTIAAEADGLLFADLPYHRKAMTSARPSAAPVAHVADVKPALARWPGIGASLAAKAMEGVGCSLDGSAQGVTLATIRYPSRGTVSI